MYNLNLVDVTNENWREICLLDPGKAGAEFVAPNSYSLAQAIYEVGWVTKGIVKDDNLIGFTMYGFCKELKAYELCRFMIDKKYQGKGYGKQALKIIIDEIKNAYGCNTIYLSTSPKNRRSKHIYTSFGFTPTGKTCGDGDNIEDIYLLKTE